MGQETEGRFRPGAYGLLVSVVAAAALAVFSSGSAIAAGTPGDCQRDSKLLDGNPIELSTEDEFGTWWYITREGFDAAGTTDYKASIEAAFGTTFDTLEDAIEALVAAVVPLDKNGNGYVCATSLRGTRAFVGDPNWAYYYFGVLDDKHL